MFRSLGQLFEDTLLEFTYLFSHELFILFHFCPLILACCLQLLKQLKVIIERIINFLEAILHSILTFLKSLSELLEILEFLFGLAQLLNDIIVQ